MKAMDEPVEGKEELMFRSEKKPLESLLFFMSLLSGSGRTSKFCGACVELCFFRPLCLFSSV